LNAMHKLASTYETQRRIKEAAELEDGSDGEIEKSARRLAFGHTGDHAHSSLNISKTRTHESG